MSFPSTLSVTESPVTPTSITQDIYDTYTARLEAGIHQDDIELELKTHLEVMGYVDVIWEDRFHWIIGNIFREEARKRRMEAIAAATIVQEPIVTVDEEAVSRPQTFGEKRVSYKAIKDSIFILPIYVPLRRDYVFIGQMTKEDWLSKAGEYLVRATSAVKRHKAAKAIADAMPDNATTEHVFSEQDFLSLIPEGGF